MKKVRKINKEKYFEISDKGGYPKRCPILHKCERRAMTLFFSHLRDCQTLKKNPGIFDQFKQNLLETGELENDIIPITGEVPSNPSGNSNWGLSRICPEVSLFDSGHIPFHTFGLAVTSGSYDKYFENQFKSKVDQCGHFSECAEFNRYIGSIENSGLSNKQGSLPVNNMPLILPPPQNWQDFEKMMKGVVDVIWPQEGWHLYGRSGQKQSGIDIYGYDSRKRFTGIQCKRKDTTDSQGMLLKHSLLSERLINKEIQKAKKINSPSLERLIFATTASRDVEIQDIVRKINDDRARNSSVPFSVEVWFWEDIQVHLEQHTQLFYWYYSDILSKIHKYDKNIHILTLIRQAFTRPAFQRGIHREENGADFIDAIKSTQEAITTGKLYNRRGDLIASSYDASNMSDDSWKTTIREIYSQLDEIRDAYQKGIKSGAIIEHPTVLEVLDGSVGEKFNQIRQDCLVKLNRVLSQAGLDIVQSELVS